MNQINLDKLLQNTLPVSSRGDSTSAGGLKLLVGEMYNARLQMLPGNEQLQLQTTQGRLSINLPPQLGQQISQQFGPQMQVSLSPAANNQISLTLQSLPGPVNSIGLNPAQLQPLLSQWLSQQLPQLVQPAAIASAIANTMQQQQPGTNSPITTNIAATKTANSLTLAVQLELKSGQLQLAGASANSSVLLTLNNKELAAVNKLMQQLAAQPLQNNTNRQPLLLRFDFNQGTSALQLSLQAPVAAQPAVATAALSAASQQQLLQSLISQLAPVKQALMAGMDKITLGQLTISVPPQLATTATNSSISLPLLLQLQAPTATSNQWQLLLQTAPQSQQLNVATNQADRPVQLLDTQTKNAATQASTATTSGTLINNQLNNLLHNALPQEARVQAWRNLLPLLAQPLMQPNLPNLPAPLQQLLSQIQQSLPEISKPLAPPMLAAQLNALLQFQPMQSQPNVQTTGGTLALAIQLLLGHLSQKQQTTANNTPANRLSQLVSQLDAGQAGIALRQLASLSSPLQQSQLATLDAQSQLQQWLLQLPLQQQGQTILPQLLLEQREADSKNGEAKQKQWQLTMKFDLQHYGNLLAVAKLQHQDLQLQFYTDHDQALRLAEKFLPLLKDRCAAQGLTVSKAECQLGKIPDSLLPRHNSLLTVKV